jgi:hypothetical protein
MMVIEDRSEVAQFMNLLATANTLYLTINSLAEGGSTASFDVAGASPAIELVHKACQGAAYSVGTPELLSSGSSSPVSQQCSMRMLLTNDHNGWVKAQGRFFSMKK